MLDDSPAYAAALLCHPSFRWHYFSNKWIGQLRKYQTPMKKALQKLYDDKYKPQPKEEEEQTGQQEGPDFLDSYLEDIFARCDIGRSVYWLRLWPTDSYLTWYAL
jgi:hypothetical protein